MIVSKLQGGLGNQIFQWAFGRNLSIINNVPFYLDTNFYKNDLPGVTKRNFSLNKFPKLKYTLVEDLQNNGKQFLRFGEEQSLDTLNYNSNYNYYLDGYFQSQKYFIESEEIIKNDLSPDDDVLRGLLNIPGINSNSISLHIRRTDYLTSNGFHPVQSIEYYKNAIETIGEYENIFIFSDDINWCKQNLSFKNMNFIEGNDELVDIWIMSLCKNNVIANSSFSWWGAWLNKNKDKKVVAPKKWFGEKVDQSNLNIIPESWITI